MDRQGGKEPLTYLPCMGASVTLRVNVIDVDVDVAASCSMKGRIYFAGIYFYSNMLFLYPALQPPTFVKSYRRFF